MNNTGIRALRNHIKDFSQGRRSHITFDTGEEDDKRAYEHTIATLFNRIRHECSALYRRFQSRYDDIVHRFNRDN